MGHSTLPHVKALFLSYWVFENWKLANLCTVLTCNVMWVIFIRQGMAMILDKYQNIRRNLNAGSVTHVGREALVLRELQ